MNTATQYETGAKKDKIKTLRLSYFIGMNVKGLIAQVRNPIYLDSSRPAQWRTLTHLKQYKERGKEWIELYWEKQADDNCNFTGCTLESDIVKIQVRESDFNNWLKDKQHETTTSAARQHRKPSRF